VVFTHVMLTSPVIANASSGAHRPPASSWTWWVTYTPLHTFWVGSEAVYIFFILSGFVLTGPALRPRFHWLAYYRKRLVRLYLPVWGSLGVAALAVALFPRDVSSAFSSWTNGHVAVSLASILKEAALLIPVQDHLNGPLWSLTWEVWFSLLLPLYILVAQWSTHARWRVLALVPALFVVMAASVVTTGALRFLPMFALGVIMYVHQDRLRAIGRHLDRSRLAWPAVALACVLLLTSTWWLQADSRMPSAVVSASRLAEVAGASGVVFVALCWESAKRALTTGALQWLGSRSFSLYLTHDPIVSTVAVVLGRSASPALVLAISLPLALTLTEIFFRVVERPSHKLAMFVGRTPRRRHAASDAARVPGLP